MQKLVDRGIISRKHTMSLASDNKMVSGIKEFVVWLKNLYGDKTQKISLTFSSFLILSR